MKRDHLWNSRQLRSLSCGQDRHVSPASRKSGLSLLEEDLWRWSSAVTAQRAGSPDLERSTDAPRRNGSVLDTLKLTLYPFGCVAMSLHDNDRSSLLRRNP